MLILWNKQRLLRELRHRICKSENGLLQGECFVGEERQLLFQLLLLLLLLLHEILTALHDHANRIVLRLESFVLGMLGVTLHQLQHRKHIRGNEARQALLRFLVLITALHPCSLFECRRHHSVCEKGDGKDSLLRVQLGRLLPLRVAPNPHHQPVLPAALTAPPRRPC